MGKHAQIVIGPAGSGKSTYCYTMQDYCNTVKRSIHVVNMDPAADNVDLKYDVSFDIRDLINLKEVMEELQLGPNGGLIYCMEYLLDNMDWFQEQVQDYHDDYLILDFPGQIELYTNHSKIIKSLIWDLQKLGYQVACVYCMDVQFVEDPFKFVSGVLMCLSAMVQLETAHLSILTKVDLLSKEAKKELEEYLIPNDSTELIYRLQQRSTSKVSKKYTRLQERIASLISEFSLVQFIPLDISDTESIEYVMSNVDYSIQYGEDLEPNDGNFNQEIDEDEDDNFRETSFEDAIQDEELLQQHPYYHMMQK